MEQTMILFLLLLTFAQTPATCVLTEGMGADFGKIGVTTQDKGGFSPRSGLILEYENNILIRILINGGDCQTSKGIKIGDAQSKVQKLYGKGKKTTAYLSKGSNDRLGKLGDFILEYPGVAFAIYKEKVGFIFITAIKTDNSPEPAR
jgi:hypothetical protein